MSEKYYETMKQFETILFPQDMIQDRYISYIEL